MSERVIGKLLSPRDGFGAIVIGPKEVGFDGDEVDWGKVTEIRTRAVAELACGAIWDSRSTICGKGCRPYPAASGRSPRCCRS
jgi:hypothetical protein